MKKVYKDKFPDMPCMKRVYRDKKAAFHLSAARNKATGGVEGAAIFVPAVRGAA